MCAWLISKRSSVRPRLPLLMQEGEGRFSGWPHKSTNRVRVPALPPTIRGVSAGRRIALQAFFAGFDSRLLHQALVMEVIFSRPARLIRCFHCHGETETWCGKNKLRGHRQTAKSEGLGPSSKDGNLDVGSNPTVRTICKAEAPVRFWVTAPQTTK